MKRHMSLPTLFATTPKFVRPLLHWCRRCAHVFLFRFRSQEMSKRFLLLLGCVHGVLFGLGRAAAVASALSQMPLLTHIACCGCQPWS